MRIFYVNAHWEADDALPEDALMNVNQRFRRDDESLCTWFDDENKGFKTLASISSRITTKTPRKSA